MPGERTISPGIRLASSAPTLALGSNAEGSLITDGLPFDIASFTDQAEIVKLIEDAKFSSGRSFQAYRRMLDMSQLPDEVSIPINARGHMLCPIEKSTGVVLPIAASLEGDNPNHHHGHFYGAHYEQGPMWLKAVRYSRLQRVGVRSHAVYHNAFNGTLFPPDTRTGFCVTVLNCAGYVPTHAVKINGDNIFIEELTRMELRRLRRPETFRTEMHPYKREVIGRFIMCHALSQDLSVIDESRVEEFLSISDKDTIQNQRLAERKLELGVKIANSALSMAVEPIKDTYHAAFKSHSVRQQMPPTPWDVAKMQIDGREPDYFDALKRRLIESHDIAA